MFVEQEFYEISKTSKLRFINWKRVDFSRLARHVSVIPLSRRSTSYGEGTILPDKWHRSLRSLYKKAGAACRGTEGGAQVHLVTGRKRRERSTRMASQFYGLTAKLLTGEAFNFSSLQGKVVLIENVASL